MKIILVYILKGGFLLNTNWISRLFDMITAKIHRDCYTMANMQISHSKGACYLSISSKVLFDERKRKDGI